MKEMNSNKCICCLLASILLFLGMSVAVADTNASFSYAENTGFSTNARIFSANCTIEEPPVCTLSMLNHGVDAIRGCMSGTMMRWQDKDVFLLLATGFCLQYLFYYQSEESKEDGQLFLCRTAIVDYIHLKDSGE